MSARGQHRRPSPGQQLAEARAQVRQLTAELTREHELRLLADGLMGRLVEDRELALEHAVRLRDEAVLTGEQLRQARDLVEGLRRQAARPHPNGAAEATQPVQIVVPLGSPHWQHVQDLADQGTARARTSWGQTA